MKNGLTAKGVIGFWKASATGDDTVEVKAWTRNKNIHLEFLRQQMNKAPGQPNISLADFIKPASERVTAATSSVPSLFQFMALSRMLERFDNRAMMITVR